LLLISRLNVVQKNDLKLINSRSGHFGAKMHFCMGCLKDNIGEGGLSLQN
jgi:hypothetical protein